VVVLTGQGDEETAVSLLKSGADDYLLKRKGYLDRLPVVLDQAVKSHRNGTARRAETIRALYLEHNPADIDLTRRHFARHAAHIEIEAISMPDQLTEIFNYRQKRETVDVLLLDYRLPGTNALELYKKLKLDAAWDIPTGC